MLKKAVLVVSGNAFGSILLLVRNLIVARLISPENYGIASTFALSMSIVEMLSYLGLQQLIIVDKDGDDPHFQASMHGFQILRGCFSSVMLFIIARPYAEFLSVQKVAWAYELLALLPLINGLQHYDPHRLRRHMNFMPTNLSNFVPALVSVLSVWPLAVVFGDYRIMLFALFFQAIAMVALSHLTAKRPYRATLDFTIMKKATKFGWPLLLNGMLMFGVFNGERLIVGRELGMGQFAFFSMCTTLTLTPTLVLANSAQSLFLPQLTRARDNPAEFQRIAVATMESSLAIALILVLGATLIGGPLSYLLTGSKYSAILFILVPMAVAQALRVAKTGSGVVGLAIGQSSNSMVGNLVRVLSLPISWWIAIRTGNMLHIIWVACVAELVGYIVAMFLVARRAKIDMTPLFAPAFLTGVTCVFALIDVAYCPPRASFTAHWHMGLLLVAASGLVAFATMSAAGEYLLRWWRNRRSVRN